MKFLILKRLLFTLLFLINSYTSFAQHLLGKVVSVNIENQTINNALTTISKARNFQFAYKSDLVLQDKKVSLKMEQKTVKQLLDRLFEGNFHYSEKGKYIMLHSGGEKQFTISGYIQNSKTGERISNVTVYEDQILVATLTNENGYFKLPIKNKHKLKTISIIARKESYSESFIDLNAGYDQELVMPLLPTAEILLKDVVIKKNEEDKSWASQVIISSKQKIQNLNIGNFIAKRPVQTSLLPGIGTHGLMGANVINKFSLNLLGGYTAGVNGVEIGGVFNINKGEVQYFQIAGVFNSVKGNIHGFEMAGIYNFINGNVGGAQVAGINNIVKGKMRGVQVAGLSNSIKGSAKGIQIAGLTNKNKSATQGIQLAGLNNLNDSTTQGLQLAGFNNRSRKKMKGMQMAGFINYAQSMKGLQFGLINIADSMDGFGLGLINYYKNGHHKIVVSANELQQLNLGYLSGTKSLYSIISLGINVGENKVYSASYGIGKEIVCNKKLAINSELIGQAYYLGQWHYVPLSLKVQLCLTYKFHKPFEFFAGPIYTITENKSTAPVSGYMHWMQDKKRNYFSLGNSINSWIGWQVGIRIF